MQKSKWAFVLLLGWGSAVFAQNTVTTGQIINAAKDDVSAAAQQRIADFQRQTNARLPLLDEIAVRTQTRRSDIYQQDYQLRFSMNGRKERSAYHQLQQTETGVTEANRLEQQYYAYYERYKDLADYYAAARTLALQQSLLAVYEDKIRLFENQAALGAANPEALMKAEFDRDELQLRIRENENILRTKITELTGNANAVLDTSRWVTVADMAAVCVRIRDSLSVHPSLGEDAAKITQLDAELQLEKAREQQVVDFLQVRYTNRPGEPFRNDFSVGAGFVIPWNGSRQARQQVLQIERYAASEELQALRSQLAAEKQKAIRRFFDRQTVVQATDQQIQTSKQRYNLDQMLQSDEDGIETVLLHQELQLRRRLKVRSYEQEMTEYYLEALFLGGFLADKNWLER